MTLVRNRAIAAASAVVATAVAVLLLWPGNSVRDGVFTLEQARRGEALYPSTCPRCHGAELAGDGFETPPLVGSDFVRRWSGRTVGELFAFVSENMPADRPGAFDSQTYIDLVAYVLRYNGYPVGSRELPPDPERLAKIGIEPR